MRIDLLKFLACFFVLLLHGIMPGEGVCEYVYLIGSYGIPLFFVVNGFLRSTKIIDLNLLKKDRVEILNI